MPEPRETNVLAILRDVFISKTTLARRLALLEPTIKLALRLARIRASLHETRLRSFSQPYRGLCSHGSRQTSGAQVDEPGGPLYATPSLSR